MTLQINSSTVKELREKTGAGMMACKKALQETEGNFDKAVETLRQKGLASEDKKSTRVASEGLIESYIHTGGKIGVLVELNCETDFVARRPEFVELSKNVAMQIASNSNIEVVSLEDIPQSIIDKTWEFERIKEDLKNKPEEIKNNIIQGRVDKSLKTQVLLEQEYIRDPSITVDEYIKQVIVLLGENIKVTRFIRYILGQ